MRLYILGDTADYESKASGRKGVRETDGSYAACRVWLVTANTPFSRGAHVRFVNFLYCAYAS